MVKVPDCQASNLGSVPGQVSEFFVNFISDSKSCLSGLNWPRSGKNSEFLALFWLVEGTLGIGWK